MRKVLVTLAAVTILIATQNASATIVDLTTAGSSGTINGAIYVQIEPRATGTGVIDSFVRVSDNGDVEEGFNTSQRPLNYDENSSPTFTHALTVGAVPIVSLGGVAYRQFMLDINQTGVDPLLSLFRLQIFLRSADLADATAANTNNVADFTGFSGAATKIYDMDAGTDSRVELNYNLNTGSGSGDMFLYVPSSLFGSDNSKFVVLYSAFGIPNNNNDGFEEWAVQEGTVPVPEPTSLILLASGLLGMAAVRRRFGKI